MTVSGAIHTLIRGEKGTKIRTWICGVKISYEKKKLSTCSNIIFQKRYSYESYTHVHTHTPLLIIFHLSSSLSASDFFFIFTIYVTCHMLGCHDLCMVMCMCVK